MTTRKLLVKRDESLVFAVRFLLPHTVELQMTAISWSVFRIGHIIYRWKAIEKSYSEKRK